MSDKLGAAGFLPGGGGSRGGRTAQLYQEVLHILELWLLQTGRAK